MKLTQEQVLNGLVQYVDHEVISNLPTAGKWILGTGIGIAMSKANDIVYELKDNTIIKAMGIVDEAGMFDEELIIKNMKESARRYGKMEISVPMIGRLSFDESDIDLLKNYLERG